MKKRAKTTTFGFAGEFVEKDIAVLPLVARSKCPATKQGLYDATTNRAKLK
jgi:hypothetical protein